jgi:hypothetical protein
MFRCAILSVTTVLAMTLLPAVDAAARIRCDGRYQIIPGAGLLSTPYCEIAYLAQVAQQSYGARTSFSQLRNSYSERYAICQFIGHDPRVSDICAKYRSDGGDRMWD